MTEIKIGDIVRFRGRQDIAVTKVRIDRNIFEGIDATGAVYFILPSDNWNKVGHMDEVEQLLNKLKGEGE